MTALWGAVRLLKCEDVCLTNAPRDPSMTRPGLPVGETLIFETSEGLAATGRSGQLQKPDNAWVCLHCTRGLEPSSQLRVLHSHHIKLKAPSGSLFLLAITKAI